MKSLLRLLFILYLATSFFQGCRNGLSDDNNSTADGIEPNSTINLTWDSNTTSAPSPLSTPIIRWVTRSADFIDRYEIALGSTPGATDITDWEITNSFNSHIFTNVSMIDCQRVYATLRSIDITDFPIQVLDDSNGLIRDISPPPFGTEIDITADDAIFNQGPLTTWTPTVDNCGSVHYEYAIGTSLGANDVVDFINVGSVSNYRIIAGQDGVNTGLNFNVGVQYFSTVRAYDEAGLYSEQSHPTFGPWYYGFDPRDLPSMVAWLDANDHSTVIDENGRNANDGLFTGNVDQVNDISGSANTHNFRDFNARPTFSIPDSKIRYTGTQCLAPSNHADLNLSTVNQRNLTVVFETSGDTNTRQIVYEEGGDVRGMNIYIANNRLYCGFYNLPGSDPDGVQPFTSVSRAINPNTKYVVTWVFDYTNYTTPNGPDGTLRCFANGVQIETTRPTTSRLFAHGGAIGLGCKNNTTFYETGVSSGNGHFFQGDILELMLFNNPPDDATIFNIHQFSAGKWGF